jgi:hypothetical protein
MSTKPTKGESFFYYIGLILLLTVIFAFSSFSIMGMSKLNSWPPIIAVHGASILLWYILFVYQARLVGIKNIQRHKKMGQMSFALTVVIIISGITIGATNYQVMKMSGMLLANVVFIFCFGVLYSFAIKYRFKPDVHKRLMLLASIAMLPPAISRIAAVFGLDYMVMGRPFLLLFFLALIIYDYRKTKKVQKSTIIGIVFIILVNSAIGPVGSSDAWNDLVVLILGN